MVKVQEVHAVNSDYLDVPDHLQVHVRRLVSPASAFASPASVLVSPVSVLVRLVSVLA